MSFAPNDIVDLRDDVEYLIDIAVRLFSTIERGISSVELSLKVAHDRGGQLATSTELKERLIREAMNLNSSLEDLARRLGEPTRKLPLDGGTSE